MASSNIGLSKVVVRFPQSRMTYPQMAEWAGLAPDKLLSLIGVKEKPVLARGENILDYAYSAVEEVLESSATDPETLDLLLFGGFSFSNKLLWSSSAEIQNRIGAKKAFSFDVAHGCNSGSTCLRIARDFLRSNEKARKVLIVLGDALSDFVDYKDQKQSSIFSFGDGAAVALVEKGVERCQVLSHSTITDARFVDDLYIDAEKKKFILLDNEVEDRALTEAYQRNYPETIRASLSELSLAPKDIKRIFMNQGSTRLIDRVEASLELHHGTVFRSAEMLGHLGNADVFYGFSESLNKNEIKPEDLIVLATSGVGYSWSSTIVRV